MTYLTNSQARRVKAYGTYTPRKLTALETVVKQVVGIHSTPIRDAGAHAANVREILRNLEAASDNYYQAGKVAAALKDPRQLKDLIQSFPYVEFEDLIVGGKLDGLEAAMHQGMTYGDLRKSALWLSDLQQLLPKLPQGVNTFLGTPRTGYAGMHMERTTRGRKECLGLSLPKDLQAEVTQLFARENYTKIKTIRLYNLHEVTNFGQIFDVCTSSAVQTVDAKLSFSDQRIGHPMEEVLTVTLSVGSEVISTYHFVM